MSPENTTGVDTTFAETTAPDTQPPVTEPPATEPPATEPPATEPPATEPPATEPPATQPPVNEPTVPPTYPLPASPAADDAFFADALFIGDSRTQGIQLYGNLKTATYYAYQGLNVVTAMNNNFIVEGGQNLTIVEALKRHPEFKKIYICLGVNEFWMAESTYKNHYETLIDAIKAAASPDAKIYMYAIFPLDDGRVASSSYNNGLNNAKMASFNAIALDIAKSRGLYFVDVSEAFLKSDGTKYIDESESWDGVHLNGTGTIKLCDYIRTHT